MAELITTTKKLLGARCFGAAYPASPRHLMKFLCGEGEIKLSEDQRPNGQGGP